MRGHVIIYSDKPLITSKVVYEMNIRNDNPSGEPFSLKLLLLLLANFTLIQFDFLKDAPRIILFNVAVILFWFLLWMRAVQRRYEKNLRWIPTCSNSIPAWHPIRQQIEDDRKKAMSSAILGIEWQTGQW